MSDTTKVPVDPSKLSELYPTPKTYDEVQNERAKIRRMRQSWQPRYPKLLIVVIILLLVASTYAAIIFVPLLGSVSVMLGALVGIFVGLLLLGALFVSVGKIRRLMDQPPHDDISYRQ